MVSADVARAATDAARCVTGYGAAKGGCGGWQTSPMVYATLQRPVAGKSGTTDNNRTAWFCGFTPQLAAAAFVADPDNPDDYVGVGTLDDLEIHPRRDTARRPQGRSPS